MIYKQSKSGYFRAQDLYKAKGNPQKIKEIIYGYLNEGRNIGIDARLIFILARTELKLGNEKEAEKIFSICMKIDSKNIPARTELGRLYVSQGRETEAEQLFKKAIEIDQRNVPPRTELGRLYVSQGGEIEAEQLFKEVIETDPENIRARTELGRLYARQGREIKAEQLFKEVIEIDPENIPARTELGKLYLRQGKNNKAEKVLKQVLEIDPEDVYAIYLIGDNFEGLDKPCLHYSQDFEKALTSENNGEVIRVCDEILKGDPNNVEALMLKQSVEEELPGTKKQAKVEDLTTYSSSIHMKEKARKLVAQAFEQISEGEMEETKKRINFLRGLNPENVTIEQFNANYYLKFLFKNITVIERFAQVNNDGQVQAMMFSPTLIIPNDVAINNGKIESKHKKLIEQQEHKGVYLKNLQDKMNLVERRYLKRKQEIDHDD